MENYVCLRCGCEVGSLKGAEMFCTKCRRKMFKVQILKSKIEDSLIQGLLKSLEEQL